MVSYYEPFPYSYPVHKAFVCLIQSVNSQFELGVCVRVLH